jgi:pSer/pThr/pTyr-binding forkhead associated (FHA) protein
MKLIIEDDEGRKTVVPFVREEITIGRQEGNTIRLTERNVSRRHARLMRQNGHVVVEDLGSSNGTRINGERISGQSTVKDGDLIQIGDYDLALQSDAQEGISTQRLRPSHNVDDDSEDDGPAREPATETETPIEEPGEEGAPAQATGDSRRHSTAIIKMDQVEGNRSRKVQELEAEEAPRLVVTNSELKGQEYACIRTEMKIGRTDDNDIVIDHRSLSRTHAKVVREDNGEWRILDMQSANGLTVNGETYAQATLNNGDIIELGHVKMRFVAAGEQPGAFSGGGRSKLPLVLALVVLALVGGAAAFFMLKPGPEEQPPQIVKDPGTTAPEPGPTPPDTATEPPAANPAADEQKKLAERVEQARKTFNEGKLEKAWDDLEPVQKDGAWPSADAQALATQIQTELNAKAAIAKAETAFSQKKFDEAMEALKLARDSKLFRAQHDSLVAEIEKAREPQPKPGQTKPPTNKPPPPDPSTNTAQAQEEARDALNSAAKLIKGKQYAEARVKASRCIELTPDNAECHLMLGVSFAHEDQWDKAKPYYKKFLQLAPDHKLAPTVRKNLSEIER